MDKTLGGIGRGGPFLPTGQTSASIGRPVIAPGGKTAYVTVGPLSLDNKSPTDTALFKIDLATGDHEVVYGPRIKNPEAPAPMQTYELVGTGPGLTKASAPAFGPDGKLYIPGQSKIGNSGQLVRLDVSGASASAQLIFADASTFAGPGKCPFSPGGPLVVAGTAAAPEFFQAYGGTGAAGIARIAGTTCNVVSGIGTSAAGSGPVWNSENSPESLSGSADALYVTQFVNAAIFKVDPKTGARTTLWKINETPNAPKVGTGCITTSAFAAVESIHRVFTAGGRASCSSGVSGLYLGVVDLTVPTAPVGEIITDMADPVGDGYTSVVALPSAPRLLVTTRDGFAEIDPVTKKSIWLAR